MPTSTTTRNLLVVAALEALQVTVALVVAIAVSITKTTWPWVTTLGVQATLKSIKCGATLCVTRRRVHTFLLKLISSCRVARRHRCDQLWGQRRRLPHEEAARPAWYDAVRIVKVHPNCEVKSLVHPCPLRHYVSRLAGLGHAALIMLCHSSERFENGHNRLT